MNPERIHPRLAGCAPPPPPERLRARALAAAARAWASPPEPWRRLWESRLARLAWALTVVALLAGHVLVSSRGARSGPSRAGGRPTGPELEELLAPYPLHLSPLAWFGETGSSRPAGPRAERPSLPEEPSS